jgi:phage/plasmid-like protein (TIGR03299 family)
MPDYFESGFCVRQPSWHGKETLLQEHPDSWEQARILAGLDWEPEYQDLYVPEVIGQGATAPEGSIFIRDLADDEHGNPMQLWHIPVAGHQAIVRNDNRKVLATPKTSFRIIKNSEMGDLAEAYSESWRKAGAKVLWDTAGSVEEGRKVYAVLLIDEPYTIPGDPSPVLPYAAFLNAHDGMGACKIVNTQTRVVCANTWKMADIDGESSGRQFVIRHTSGAGERLEEAKAALSVLRDEVKAYQVLATDLATINVSDALVQTFLSEFIPIPENASERTRTQRQERQGMFMALYASSPTTDGIRGSAYGLVQAAGEYLDHLRPYRNADTYLARTLLYSEPIKGNAVRLVRQLVKEGV